MFLVIVLELDGTVRDAVGPFWDEKSAEQFAERNVTRIGLRFAVKRIEERGVWLDGMRRITHK